MCAGNSTMNQGGEGMGVACFERRCWPVQKALTPSNFSDIHLHKIRAGKWRGVKNQPVKSWSPSQQYACRSGSSTNPFSHFSHTLPALPMVGAPFPSPEEAGGNREALTLRMVSAKLSTVRSHQ